MPRKRRLDALCPHRLGDGLQLVPGSVKEVAAIGDLRKLDVLVQPWRDARIDGGACRSKHC